MKYLFATIATALALASTTATAAPTLIGDSVTIRYERPTLGTLQWTDTVVVGAGAEIACPGPSPACTGVPGGNLFPGESIDIGALSIGAVFIDFFLAEAFNGLVFEGLDFGGGDLVGFSLVTTIPGLTASDISFTASSLRVNLSGIGPAGNFNIELQVRESAVPEPGALALAALSLGLLAVTRRRA